MGAFSGGGLTRMTLSEDDAAMVLSWLDNAYRGNETP
jgi:hypothetical protein